MKRVIFISAVCFFSFFSSLLAEEYSVSPNGCFPSKEPTCEAKYKRPVFTDCGNAFERTTFSSFNEALSFLQQECTKAYKSTYKAECSCKEQKNRNGGDYKVLKTWTTTVKCNPLLSTPSGAFFLADQGINPVQTVDLGTYFYSYFCDNNTGIVDVTKRCATTGKDTCK